MGEIGVGSQVGLSEEGQALLEALSPRWKAANAAFRAASKLVSDVENDLWDGLRETEPHLEDWYYQVFWERDTVTILRRRYPDYGLRGDEGHRQGG